MMNMAKFGIGKLSIRNRLRIGLGLIIAFMVLLTITGILSLGGMKSKLERIIDINTAKIELAYSIQNAVAVIDKSVLSMMVANDVENTKVEQKRIGEAQAKCDNALARLQKLESAAKGKELIKTLKENIAVARQMNDTTVKLMESGAGDSAKGTFSATAQISAVAAEACDQVVKYQEESIKASAKEARATYGRALYMLVITGALVLLFAAFLAGYLERSITAPLNEGVSIAQRIAEGDLTVEIETSATDETGQLFRAMKNMMQSLQNIIGEVKGAAGNMAAASRQLNSNSDLMSKGAGEQASRASQVATASEEMSHTVLDIAKNTSSIELSATDTAKLARDGETVVDRSVEKVKAIARTVDESARLIKLLGERSDQIGAILNVINDIADQTNLLALNAAIEAARAGDAGRGFAVVADEVRKLAERTGSSTKEIGTMIRSIQDEVSRAVSSMDGITSEVRLGVDLSTQGGDVLRSIVGSVEQLHVMVQQIASATEEMAATSDEINKDIETIASVSRETSGNSEQINQASRELAELSVNLERAVDGFRV